MLFCHAVYTQTCAGEREIKPLAVKLKSTAKPDKSLAYFRSGRPLVIEPAVFVVLVYCFCSA